MPWTLPNPDGTWLAISQIDTMVDDAEAFMTRYKQFIEQVMITEPIDIFAWPTFLPVPSARQYAQLWTPKRVPNETFITGVKQAGLKFTFGTDSRNQKATHFYHCYQMAQRCGLTEGDMFVVKRK